MLSIGNKISCFLRRLKQFIHLKNQTGLYLEIAQYVALETPTYLTESIFEMSNCFKMEILEYVTRSKIQQYCNISDPLLSLYQVHWENYQPPNWSWLAWVLEKGTCWAKHNREELNIPFGTHLLRSQHMVLLQMIRCYQPSITINH